MSRLRHVWCAVLTVALLVATLATSACTDEEQPPESTLDTRLQTHAVLDGPPSAAGLAYVQAIADAHRQADRSGDGASIRSILLAAVQRPLPPGDGTAELLHYEILARASEHMLNEGDSEAVVALLEPRLAPEVSLPIDRASARALIALGDAAAHTGELDLAMGSYARALDMLMLLLEEVES